MIVGVGPAGVPLGVSAELVGGLGQQRLQGRGLGGEVGGGRGRGDAVGVELGDELPAAGAVEEVGQTGVGALTEVVAAFELGAEGEAGPGPGGGRGGRGETGVAEEGAPGPNALSGVQKRGGLYVLAHVDHLGGGRGGGFGGGGAAGDEIEDAVDLRIRRFTAKLIEFCEGVVGTRLVKEHGGPGPAYGGVLGGGDTERGQVGQGAVGAVVTTFFEGGNQGGLVVGGQGVGSDQGSEGQGGVLLTQSQPGGHEAGFGVVGGGLEHRVQVPGGGTQKVGGQGEVAQIERGAGAVGERGSGGRGGARGHAASRIRSWVRRCSKARCTSG